MKTAERPRTVLTPPASGLSKVIKFRSRHNIRPTSITLPCFALTFLLTLVFCGFLNGAEQSGSGANARSNPNQFVREVLNNEVQAEAKDQAYWRFQETDHENGRKELSDVVDTKYGEIKRRIKINGQPVNARQKQEQDQQIASLLSDPSQIKEQRTKTQADAGREEKMLKMLPDAFRYQYEGMDGQLTKLRFFPNAGFHPPSYEAKVFHHMTGTIWLDGKQKRLARIDGRLTSDVLFGYGLLGRLYKGGTFSVIQVDLGSGHWEMKKLVVQMNGKALFFKTIGAHQNQSFTGYEEVPAGLTLKQAAALLNSKSVKSAGESARLSSARPDGTAGHNR